MPVMQRKQPTSATLKALFAKSGNKCAFPDCTNPIIYDRQILVAEVCHINAIAAQGARFDPSLDDDYLRSYENLILLCHAHHRRVDVLEGEFSVTTLKEMRRQHEANCVGPITPVPESIIHEALILLTAEAEVIDLLWVAEELEDLVESGTVWGQQPMNRLLAGVSCIVDAQLRLHLLRLLPNLSEKEQLELLREQSQWEDERQKYVDTGIDQKIR
ncbi:MAG: HNH endonuclease [Candidatus Hydrogenedentes bacterium]|nr:HNH endonuclease [Candidatus Hydrogenedentota bacterium]